MYKTWPASPFVAKLIGTRLTSASPSVNKPRTSQDARVTLQLQQSVSKHQFLPLQAQATVTVNRASASPNPGKAAAADLADKEQTILELRETNEVSTASSQAITATTVAVNVASQPSLHGTRCCRMFCLRNS